MAAKLSGGPKVFQASAYSATKVADHAGFELGSRCNRDRRGTEDRPAQWRGQRVGGTSASTPLVTAGLLLTQEHLAAAGNTTPRLWTPALYSTSDPIEMTDATEGSNDLRGADCCTAVEGFDRASGLGTPGFAP